MVGDGLVTAALGAAGDELLVPGVDLPEVRVASLGQRPDEIEGGRALVVGAQQAGGIRPPGARLEGDVVYRMAPERRQCDAADLLLSGAARLGELAGDAPQLYHGEPGG